MRETTPFPLPPVRPNGCFRRLPLKANSCRYFAGVCRSLQEVRMAAFTEYAEDVRSGGFPGPPNILEIDEQLLNAVRVELG